MHGSLTAAMVEVAGDAVIEGDLTAGHVQLAGSIMGDISAKDVTMTPTARFSGRLTYGSISIASGAAVAGEMRRLAANPEERVPPTDR